MKSHREETYCGAYQELKEKAITGKQLLLFHRSITRAALRGDGNEFKTKSDSNSSQRARCARGLLRVSIV